ncbi:MAG: putative threonine/homoserine efflux protein [Marmoricola sp.]|nr:putative threonine/homoserine efflux protein [Marmoricola sp.]
MTIAFLAAIQRIPLGTAVAVEFLGPLTVAAVRSHSKRALAWPALALVGVVLLTEPWHGGINAFGLGFAGLAAIGWGTYILLTQRIGDSFAGITGLLLTVPVAAATAAVLGIPQATGHLTPGALTGRNEAAPTLSSTSSVEPRRVSRATAHTASPGLSPRPPASARRPGSRG